MSSRGPTLARLLLGSAIGHAILLSRIFFNHELRRVTGLIMVMLWLRGLTPSGGRRCVLGTFSIANGH